MDTDISENIIKFSLFSSLSHIVQGVSTRKLGSIKEKGIIFPDPLGAFAKELGISVKNIVFVKQTHGAAILHVRDNNSQILGDGDGLITDKKGIAVGMVTADCLPIILADSKSEIVGVIHAGYRGILGGVIENMIDKLVNKGLNLKTILVGIGPGIGVCCYDVTPARLALFEKKYGKSVDFFQNKKSKIYLDLKKIVETIFQNQGISKEHIQTLPLCTSCDNDQFFSYRKDLPETFGQFATIIGIR